MRVVHYCTYEQSQVSKGLNLLETCAIKRKDPDGGKTETSRGESFPGNIEKGGIEGSCWI